MNKTQVIIADDHRLVRTGLKSLLEQMENIEVVAEAEDGREAINLVEQLHPQLAIMDISMQNLNGIDATRYLTKYHPDTQVIILSVHEAKEYVLQALQAGARGYLLKTSHPYELKIAVETVINGATYLTPTISHSVVADYLRRVESPTGESGEFNKLTLRQREILQLIVEGHSSRSIADQLNIGIKTVETHRRRIKDALHIYDLPGLVKFAIREGIISEQT